MRVTKEHFAKIKNMYEQQRAEYFAYFAAKEVSEVHTSGITLVELSKVLLASVQVPVTPANVTKLMELYQQNAGFEEFAGACKLELDGT